MNKSYIKMWSKDHPNNIHIQEITDSGFICINPKISINRSDSWEWFINSLDNNKIAWSNWECEILTYDEVLLELL